MNYFGHKLFYLSMKLISINTGFICIPMEDMFTNLKRILPDIDDSLNDKNHVVCSIRSLLLQKSSRIILIDTGVGTLIDREVLTHYEYRSEGDWDAMLRLHDLTPADITDVILTHLHFDHCGGAVRSLPDSASLSKATLTFPNAIHWISRAQWEWAQNVSEREPDSFFEHTFLPIQQQGRLKLVEKESEIIPGIKVRLFNGHTRGLMVPIISSGNETMVFAGDLIPTSAHLNPDIGMSYDLDPDLIRREKEGFLAEIKNKGWIIVFQHEPVSKGERR